MAWGGWRRRKGLCLEGRKREALCIAGRRGDGSRANDLLAEGAATALSVMYNAPILRRMASPGVSCTRSVLNAPGLALHADIGALCTIPVTLQTHARHKAAKNTCVSGKTPLSHSLPGTV